MLTEVSPTTVSVQSRDQANAESARGKMERCAAEPRSREKVDQETFPYRQKIDRPRRLELCQSTLAGTLHFLQVAESRSGPSIPGLLTKSKSVAP